MERQAYPSDGSDDEWSFVAPYLTLMTRFRRLARAYERLPETLAGLHLLAYTVLMLHRFALVMAHCP
jgi:hypothetical protein